MQDLTPLKQTSPVGDRELKEELRTLRMLLRIQRREHDAFKKGECRCAWCEMVRDRLPKGKEADGRAENCDAT